LLNAVVNLNVKDVAQAFIFQRMEISWAVGLFQKNVFYLKEQVRKMNETRCS
jgi:hypothetical protein